MRFNGGIIGPKRISNATVASGIFGVSEHQVLKGAGELVKLAPPPAPAGPDENFNLTTLLLSGNGTNGAQNSTFLDSSPNTFTINRSGNTTQGAFSPFSPAGWSTHFNGTGSNQRLDLPSNAVFTLGSSNFTIEFWFLANEIIQNSGIFQYSSTAGALTTTATGQLSVQIYNGGIYLGNNGGFSQLVAPYSIGVWTHVAIVRSGTTITVYVDGTSKLTVTDSHSYTGTYLTLGAFYATQYVFDGYISNFRFVNGTAVYTTDFTVPTAPLSAITGTSLLTCQSNRFKDNSSNDFTITVNGTPSIQAFSPFAPIEAYAASTHGGSAYFDGAGDYLSIANGSVFSFGTGSFTVSTWVYPTLSGPLRICSSNWTNTISDPGSWLFYIDTSASTMVFLHYVSGFRVYSVSAPIPVNAWSFITVSVSGSTIYFSFNGTVYSTSFTTGSIVGSTTDNVIGAEFRAGDVFKGYMADFRAVAGTALYTSTYTPPIEPMTSVSGTTLLCKFNNAGVIDSTAKNTLETAGTAQISDSQSKFGGSSIYFNGSSDYLLTGPSIVNNIETGNLTIEFWAYTTASASGQEMIQVDKFDSTYGPIIGYQSGSQFVVYLSSLGNSWDIASGKVLGTVNLNTWTHYAFTRAGSNFYTFMDGNLQDTWVSSSNIYQSANQVTVGNGQLNKFYNGYIDELRITKGNARYTANFTPTVNAFPVQ